MYKKDLKDPELIRSSCEYNVLIYFLEKYFNIWITISYLHPIGKMSKLLNFNYFEHYFVMERVKMLFYQDVAFSQQIDANVGLARLTQRG